MSIPGDRGVLLSELRCPTCGQPFGRELIRDEEPDITTLALGVPEIVSMQPPYMICGNSHKWSIKTLYRSMYQEDQVLLDRYLGMT